MPAKSAVVYNNIHDEFVSWCNVKHVIKKNYSEKFLLAYSPENIEIPLLFLFVVLLFHVENNFKCERYYQSREEAISKALENWLIMCYRNMFRAINPFCLEKCNSSKQWLNRQYLLNSSKYLENELRAREYFLNISKALENVLLARIPEYHWHQSAIYSKDGINQFVENNSGQILLVFKL